MRLVVSVISTMAVIAGLISGGLVGSPAVANGEFGGTPDVAFIEQINANGGVEGGTVNDAVVQSDGKIVIGGSFNKVAG